MLKELDKLINFIQTEYIEFNEKWQNSSYYSKIKRRIQYATYWIMN